MGDEKIAKRFTFKYQGKPVNPWNTVFEVGIRDSGFITMETKLLGGGTSSSGMGREIIRKCLQEKGNDTLKQKLEGIKTEKSLKKNSSICTLEPKEEIG